MVYLPNGNDSAISSSGTHERLHAQSAGEQTQDAQPSGAFAFFARARSVGEAPRPQSAHRCQSPPASSPAPARLGQVLENQVLSGGRRPLSSPAGCVIFGSRLGEMLCASSGSRGTASAGWTIQPAGEPGATGVVAEVRGSGYRLGANHPTDQAPRTETPAVTAYKLAPTRPRAAGPCLRRERGRLRGATCRVPIAATCSRPPPRPIEQACGLRSRAKGSSAGTARHITLAKPTPGVGLRNPYGLRPNHLEEPRPLARPV
jgi:hypothetical protein